MSSYVMSHVIKQLCSTSILKYNNVNIVMILHIVEEVHMLSMNSIHVCLSFGTCYEVDINRLCLVFE